MPPCFSEFASLNSACGPDFCIGPDEMNPASTIPSFDESPIVPPVAQGVFEGENSLNWPVGSGNPITDIWQDALGLPSGLSCPAVGGISSFICGGVDPILDAQAIPLALAKIGPQMSDDIFDKLIMSTSCLFGQQPEYMTPSGENPPYGNPDSTDDPSGTQGQGPPSGPNKNGKKNVPYGPSPEGPNGVADGVAAGASTLQCLSNVWTTWPKKQ